LSVTSKGAAPSSTSAPSSISTSPIMCPSVAALVRAPKPNFQSVCGAQPGSVRLCTRSFPSCTTRSPSEACVTSKGAQPPLTCRSAGTHASSSSLNLTSMRWRRPESSDTRRPTPTPSSPNGVLDSGPNTKLTPSAPHRTATPAPPHSLLRMDARKDARNPRIGRRPSMAVKTTEPVCPIAACVSISRLGQPGPCSHGTGACQTTALPRSKALTFSPTKTLPARCADDHESRSLRATPA